MQATCGAATGEILAISEIRTKGNDYRQLFRPMKKSQKRQKIRGVNLYLDFLVPFLHFKNPRSR